MEVCEACLEIVPYQILDVSTDNWWLENEAEYRRLYPCSEPKEFRLANNPFNSAIYVGVCSQAGVRWTHEQWGELACRRCRYYRREMIKMLCMAKGQCTKWQVEKRVPAAVRVWKKIKTVIKSVLAAGKRGIGRGLGRRGFDQLTG